MTDSSWNPNTVTPEKGRKIEYVIDHRTREVDTYDDGLSLAYFDWKDVKLWRYVDD